MPHEKVGEACYLNKDVLMHCDEGGDRPVAPMLHSRQAGTLNTCFRSMEDAAASVGGQLALVFIGDSVTRGMSHQTIRWLDGGSWSPRWGAPPELLKSLLVKAGHSAALLSLTLSGMYSKPIRGMLNLPQFLDSMKKQMEEAVPRCSRGIFVFGIGSWDLVFSEENDRVGVFHSRQLDTLRQVTRLAGRLCSGKVDFFVRNSFFSYDPQKKEHPWLARFNEAQAQLYATLLQESKGGVPSERTETREPFPENVELHYLDAFALSVPRKTEMPLKLLDTDGLHWQCVNIEKKGQMVNLCNRQLALPDQRPDEVSWASMQVVFVDVCAREKQAAAAAAAAEARCTVEPGLVV